MWVLVGFLWNGHLWAFEDENIDIENIGRPFKDRIVHARKYISIPHVFYLPKLLIGLKMKGNIGL